jgi:hypothetical protein
MSDEKDTHTLLIETLQKYYKVNEIFEQRKTKPWKIEGRKLLSEIRRLASIRRQEIMDTYNDERAIRLEKMKDQKTGNKN